MAGSLRVDGGTQALTDALAAGLPGSPPHPATPVLGIERERACCSWTAVAGRPSTSCSPCRRESAQV